MTKITVSSACKCLGVSTSGYYAWRKRQIYVNQKYTDLKAVYWQHHARLGAPSLVHDMHDLGYCMSERTVGRMLKKLSRHYLYPNQRRLAVLMRDARFI